MGTTELAFWKISYYSENRLIPTKVIIRNWLSVPYMLLKGKRSDKSRTARTPLILIVVPISTAQIISLVRRVSLIRRFRDRNTMIRLHHPNHEITMQPPDTINDS